MSERFFSERNNPSSAATELATARRKYMFERLRGICGTIGILGSGLVAWYLLMDGVQPGETHLELAPLDGVVNHPWPMPLAITAGALGITIGATDQWQNKIGNRLAPIRERIIELSRMLNS